VPRSPSHWLSMIDIDHFKLVNDTFGHLYGDEVLLFIAGIMKRCFRSGDALFRFGGEEFVVIIADASRDQACVAFERFRTMVENYDFPQVGRVTVSFGAVEAHPGIDPTTLLGRADQALYFAKEHGRNRVVFWEDLPRRSQPREVSAAGSIDLF
jgi:diguanylate cyclase (GGDEF)-like protein